MERTVFRTKGFFQTLLHRHVSAFFHCAITLRRCKWPSFRGVERARPLVHTQTCCIIHKDTCQIFSLLPPFFALTAHLLLPEAFLCLPTRENLSFRYLLVFLPCLVRPAFTPRSHFKTSFHRVIKAALLFAPQHTYTTHTYIHSIPFFLSGLLYFFFSILSIILWITYFCYR